MDIVMPVLAVVLIVVLVATILISGKRQRDRGAAVLAAHPDAARLFVPNGESISKGAKFLGVSETTTVERVNGERAGWVPKTDTVPRHVVVPPGDAVLRIGYEYRSQKAPRQAFAPADFSFTFAPNGSYQLVFDHDARTFRMVPFTG